jgi:uncharacterized protein
MAAVKFEEQIEMPGSPSDIWEFLWDVPRVSKCVPGCREIQTVSPDKHYKAVVEQRVGHFKAVFDLDITVVRASEPGRLEVSVRGKDLVTKTVVTAGLVVELEPQGEHSTLRLTSTVKLLGKLGTLGQSVVERKSEEVLHQFVAALAPELEASKSERLGHT